MHHLNIVDHDDHDYFNDSVKGECLAACSYMRGFSGVCVMVIQELSKRKSSFILTPGRTQKRVGFTLTSQLCWIIVFLKGVILIWRD